MDVAGRERKAQERNRGQRARDDGVEGAGDKWVVDEGGVDSAR